MKAILMSVKPLYVFYILTGKKIKEIRKRFPKDFVGWIYIYCTKDKTELYYTDKGYVLTDFGIGSYYKNAKLLNGKVVARIWCDDIEEYECEFWEEGLFDDDTCYQGIRQIIRDEDYPDDYDCIDIKTTNEDGFNDEEVVSKSEFLKSSCLNLTEMKKYVGLGTKTIYAININNMERFEEPKCLNEFKKPYYCDCKLRCNNNLEHSFCREYCSHNLDKERLSVCCDRDGWVKEWNNKNTLTKAPQSWCYVEL